VEVGQLIVQIRERISSCSPQESLPVHEASDEPLVLIFGERLLDEESTSQRLPRVFNGLQTGQRTPNVRRRRHFHSGADDVYLVHGLAHGLKRLPAFDRLGTSRMLLDDQQPTERASESAGTVWPG
jgi:hypothetical protein